MATIGNRSQNSNPEDLVADTQLIDQAWNPVTRQDDYSRRFFYKFKDVMPHPDRLEEPMHWQSPRRVFLSAKADLFHEELPRDFVLQVFAIMAMASQHLFHVVTNLPDRMRELLGEWEYFRHEMNQAANRIPWREGFPDVEVPWAAGYPLPNVWLGVSCDDQEMVDKSIPILLDTPAAVRFVICDPDLLVPKEVRRLAPPEE